MSTSTQATMTLDGFRSPHIDSGVLPGHRERFNTILGECIPLQARNSPHSASPGSQRARLLTNPDVKIY